MNRSIPLLYPSLKYEQLVNLTLHKEVSCQGYSFTSKSWYSSNSTAVKNVFGIHFPLSVAGLRLPMYKALACKAPVLPAAPIPVVEPKPSDIDVSDLGSRNYAARSDFYCLVTEDIWSTLPSLPPISTNNYVEILVSIIYVNVFVCFLYRVFKSKCYLILFPLTKDWFLFFVFFTVV